VERKRGIGGEKKRERRKFHQVKDRGKWHLIEKTTRRKNRCKP